MNLSAHTLLIRLAGPMQSWGTQSRFTDRDTGLEPSKSGVIGLLCAALGRPRSEPVDDLAALRMAVRVDREGSHAVDFHTTGGGRFMGKPYGVQKSDGKVPGEKTGSKFTVLSRRHYLADAFFIVALESPDKRLLEQLDHALDSPHWPLYLGRKSFTPGLPVRLPGGLIENTRLEDALRSWPWSPPPRTRDDNLPARLRVVLDAEPGTGGQARTDVPLSFEKRSFTTRFVATDWLETADLPKGGDPLCISPA